MVFQSFETGPLIKGQESKEFEFVVLLSAPTTFVRVAAHFADDELLQGTPPTFEIRAGSGARTAVTAGEEAVSIPGSGGDPVAAAVSQRTEESDDDAYVLRIDHHTPSGPWRMRLRNNETETLRFHGFISHTEQETRQPWVEVVDGAQARLGDEAETVNATTLRNVGTKKVILKDMVGTRVGPEGSPAFVASRPDSIAPHHTGTITVKCPPLEVLPEPRILGFAHTFNTDDPNPTHATVQVRIVFPGSFVPPPPPGSACNDCVDCPGFSPRSSNPFTCKNCGHSKIPAHVLM